MKKEICAWVWNPANSLLSKKNQKKQSGILFIANALKNANYTPKVIAWLLATVLMEAEVVP